MPHGSRLSMDAKMPIWVGYFPSFREACLEAESRNADMTRSAFESSRWVQRQLEMYAEARTGGFPRATSLPLLAAAIDAHVIVDFGGGTGWPIELLGEETLEILESYVVVEQAQFIDEVSQSDQLSVKVKFCEADSPRTWHGAVDLL